MEALMEDLGFFVAEESEEDKAATESARRRAPEAEASLLRDEELDVAHKVLSTLLADPENYPHQRYRDIRQVLRDLYKLDSERFCQGMSIEEYRDSLSKHRDTHSRRMRQMALDKQHINSKRLRQQRLQALKDLQERADRLGLTAASVGVPDGPALADAGVPTAALENGETATAAEEEAQYKLQRVYRSCYICKGRFDDLHRFYDMLCPTCAPLNYEKRLQSADCNGRLAIVTGGRVKIGYQIAIKLLRAGAHVIVTTRFPNDAIERFAREADFDQFRDRIRCYGLDLRDLASVEAFCGWMYREHPHLDMIVNNACQTIRRPPAYYRHLIQGELKPIHDRTEVVDGGHHSAWLAQLMAPAPSKSVTAASEQSGSGNGHIARNLPASALAALNTQVPTVLEDYEEDTTSFPEGATDVHKQQLDLRTTNSWVLRLGEVSTPEAAEVMAVNALSPFVLNGKLRALLAASPHDTRFIVNVSAMEGKFYRFKTPNHPHTNMAKAALNMMTRTSAQDYKEDNIYMNAVDTGWINDENPLPHAARIATEHNFQTPIDEIDAAARVLDPIFDGINTKKPMSGKFLKDYVETEW